MLSTPSIRYPHYATPSTLPLSHIRRYTLYLTPSHHPITPPLLPSYPRTLLPSHSRTLAPAYQFKKMAAQEREAEELERVYAARAAEGEGARARAPPDSGLAKACQLLDSAYKYGDGYYPATTSALLLLLPLTYPSLLLLIIIIIIILTYPSLLCSCLRAIKLSQEDSPSQYHPYPTLTYPDPPPYHIYFSCLRAVKLSQEDSVAVGEHADSLTNDGMEASVSAEIFRHLLAPPADWIETYD